MDVQERREVALRILQDRGEVSVTELSEAAGVSAMTIRRDLEILERGGALRRVHGGAISLASRGFAAPYPVRASRHSDAKERIGWAAATLLGEGETVVLDVGTTTLQVARALSERRGLTVITPSLRVADVLSQNNDIRLMLTGGIVVPSELSLVGDAPADRRCYLCVSRRRGRSRAVECS